MIESTSAFRCSGEGPDADDGDERRRKEQMMNPSLAVEKRYENSVTTLSSSNEWNLMNLKCEISFHPEWG